MQVHKFVFSFSPYHVSIFFIFEKYLFLINDKRSNLIFISKEKKSKFQCYIIINLHECLVQWDVVVKQSGLLFFIQEKKVILLYDNQEQEVMIVTTRSRGLNAHKTLFLKASISYYFLRYVTHHYTRNFSLKDRLIV